MPTHPDISLDGNKPAADLLLSGYVFWSITESTCACSPHYSLSHTVCKVILGDQVLQIVMVVLSHLEVVISTRQPSFLIGCQLL